MSFVNAVAKGTTLNDIYPIGSVIIKSAPWAGFAGQTWELFSQGKTLVGQDPNQSVADQAFADFTTLGGPGGDVKHTLSIDEMPSHTHENPLYKAFEPNGRGLSHSYVPTGFNTDITTSSTGGGQPHTIVQPYQVALYYRRTA